MQRSVSSSGPRLRQACERCRQKKTRCPGERPMCSFCERLGQTCTYLQRGRDRRAAGPRGMIRGPNGSQATTGIPDLNQRLKKTPNLPSPQSPLPDGDPVLRRLEGRDKQPESRRTDGAIPRRDNQDNIDASTWSPENPDPPPDMLYHFVEVYRQHLYFQPIPLFDVQYIYDNLQSFPSFLRWAFLAIALRFTKHPFYGGNGMQASEFYIASSRQAIMRLALDGVSELEVLQALCLLALCEIKDGLRARACMTIGVASQLQCVRVTQAQAQALHSRASNDPASSRCHWSILILESTFSSHPGARIQGIDPPDCPRSPARPLPLSASTSMREHPDLFDSNEVNGRDYGINAYCLQKVQIWGEIVSYMESIRTEKHDRSSIASHNQLTLKMYESESKLSYQHLFRKVRFQHRQPSELSGNREYWAPWILMQISYHGSQAALNHPFIHLVALRGSQGASQSRSFLQETLDRALFHSSWVSRFLQICEELQFDISDPLIGQIVATTATVPWLFQFVRDDAISSRAKRDFETCERVLGRISTHWPHIAQMVQTRLCPRADLIQAYRTLQYQKLRSLQSTIEQREGDEKSDRTTVQFPPDVVWQLLSPQATTASRLGLSDYHGPSPGNGISTATLQITTTIVHPATEDELSHQTEVDAQDTQMPWEDVFDQPFLTNLLSDSLVEDYSWLPFN